MKVLIVEDDPMILRALEMALEREGFEVITASNGNEALEIISSQNIDTLLTDIIMPEKEGLETILAVKSSHPDMLIIAMTSGGRTKSFDLLLMAEKFGADAILKKPFKPEELIKIIKEKS